MRSLAAVSSAAWSTICRAFTNTPMEITAEREKNSSTTIISTSSTLPW